MINYPLESFRKLLRCKIHRATITHADLNYEGSITISPELMEVTGVVEFEAVWIWDVTNGNRLETYVISGESGSSDICINGAAAHLIHPGDIVIIAAFGMYPESEARVHEPVVVLVDEKNAVKEVRREVPGPALKGKPERRIVPHS